MILGWQLFMQAAWMLWRNLGAALRLSLGPAFVVGAYFGALLTLLGGLGNAFAPGSGAAGMIGLMFLAGIAGGFVLVVVALLWVAVGWHRHVLLDQPVRGIFPPFLRGRIGAYMGRSVVVFVLTATVSVVVGGLVMMVVPPLTGARGIDWRDLLGSPVWSGGLGLAGAIIGYRLAPMLPAAAIGQPMGVAGAWRATAGQMPAFVVLAVITMGASIMVQGIGAVIGDAAPVAGIVWNIAAGWFMGLLTISLLTSIHAHFAQAGSPSG